LNWPERQLLGPSGVTAPLGGGLAHSPATWMTKGGAQVPSTLAGAALVPLASAHRPASQIGRHAPGAHPQRHAFRDWLQLPCLLAECEKFTFYRKIRVFKQIINSEHSYFICDSPWLAAPMQARRPRRLPREQYAGAVRGSSTQGQYAGAVRRGSTRSSTRGQYVHSQ